MICFLSFQFERMLYDRDPIEWMAPNEFKPFEQLLWRKIHFCFSLHSIYWLGTCDARYIVGRRMIQWQKIIKYWLHFGDDQIIVAERLSIHSRTTIGGKIVSYPRFFSLFLLLFSIAILWRRSQVQGLACINDKKKETHHVWVIDRIINGICFRLTQIGNG